LPAISLFIPEKGALSPISIFPNSKYSAKKWNIIQFFPKIIPLTYLLSDAYKLLLELSIKTFREKLSAGSLPDLPF